MSNMINKMKKDREKLNQNKAFDRMRDNKSTNIDFKTRVIPKTLIVDVRNSVVYVGDDKNIINDCRRIETGITLESNELFLDELRKFRSEDIEKVILDNGDGFKIMALDEFVNNVELNLNKLKKSNISRLFILDEEFGSFFKIIQDSNYDYFCISNKESDDSTFTVISHYSNDFKLIDSREFLELSTIDLIKEFDNDHFVLVGYHGETNVRLIVIDKYLNIFATNDISINDHLVMIRSVSIVDGYIYVIGLTESSDFKSSHALIAKFDKYLKVIDIKLFDSKLSNFIGFVASTPITNDDGDQIVVIGAADSTVTDKMICPVVRFNTDLSIKEIDAFVISENTVISDIAFVDDKLICCGFDFDTQLKPIIVNIDIPEAFTLESDLNAFSTITTTKDNIIFSGRSSIKTNEGEKASILVTDKALNISYGRQVNVSDKSMITNVIETNVGLLASVVVDRSNSFAVETNNMFQSSSYNDKAIFDFKTVRKTALSVSKIPYVIFEKNTAVA